MKGCELDLVLHVLTYTGMCTKIYVHPNIHVVCSEKEKLPDIYSPVTTWEISISWQNKRKEEEEKEEKTKERGKRLQQATGRGQRLKLDCILSTNSRGGQVSEKKTCEQCWINIRH